MNDKDTEFNHLLIIDDNEAIHQDFAKIFASTDPRDDLRELDAELFGEEEAPVDQGVEFDLQFASQGEEGFNVLKSAYQRGIRFGTAFVDMRMPPGWDGVETIENLWKIDPDLQVVICTAYSDKSWGDIIKRLGQTDQLLILKKPFDEIEVVQLANSLTKKRRLLAESRERVESLEEVVETRECELQAAHKDAEILIDSMASILVSVDENGLVSRWNPVAEHSFGICGSNAIGVKFEELPIEWKNWPALAQAFHDCCVIQQTQIEVQFSDTDGQLRTLDATICPILNDATSRARLVLATDVTEQKALKTQLDQALRMESVGQLAAGVAHEINTPMQYIGDNVRFVEKSLKKLNPILSCLHVLADPDVTDEQLDEVRKLIPETMKASKIKSSLQQIPDALSDSIEGVEAVSKIVAAMKEFSHPGSDQKSQACVNHILESTITVAKNEWKYVADVETDFEQDLTKIEALPSELNQAFLNIIVNASHAIGDRVKSGDFEKGSIKLATKTQPDHVVITVQDNGGGIPASARDRIFEPFFTTKDVGKGTGQGLAIAYSIIVKKHGGKLTFEVDEGVGTTFQIELPHKSPTEESPSEMDEVQNLNKVAV